MKIVDSAIRQTDSTATGKAIVRLVIADTPGEPTEQPEHIIVQVEIDVPPGQPLGLLQTRVLDQVTGILSPLAREIERVVRQRP